LRCVSGPDPRTVEREIEGRCDPHGPRDEGSLRRDLVVLLGPRHPLRYLRLLPRTPGCVRQGRRRGPGRVRGMTRGWRKIYGGPGVSRAACTRPTFGRSPRFAFWRKAATK